MFSHLLIVTGVILLGGSGFARQRLLVEFDTQDSDSTMAWAGRLEDRGIMVRHLFPPNAAIVDAPDVSVENLRPKDNKWRLYTSADLLERPGIPLSKAARAAFLSLETESSTPRTEVLSIPEPPYDGPSEPDAAPEASLFNRLTGQYLIGYVAVGIYLIESSGSQENWWLAAEQQTVNEIVQGLDWLSDEAFKRGAKVVWVYPPYEKINTSYEPINDQHVPYYTLLNWHFNWLDDIYAAHGVSDEWDGAYELANQLRRTYGTNWAMEIAVVMDQNDADHKFSDGYFAYSSPYANNSPGRSPIVVMTYNNNGYGPAWMDEVVSHEASHVFGASDEYWNPEHPASDCDMVTDCGPHSSYLQTNNGNCEVCNSNSVDCFMKRATWPPAVCSFTPAELGWRDQWLPGNGVMDPVDQYSQSYMWISPVAAGDRITIVSLGGELMNVISVSPDMLVGASNNVILWDGVMYDDALAPIAPYPVSKNGSGLGSFLLNVSSPTTYTIPSHSYQLDVITYQNANAALCFRHTILDSLGNIYSRPRFDVMTNANASFNVSLAGYEDGIYTSVVYGHRSDGLRTNSSSITFINYICGDINNDGSLALEDVLLLSDFLFVNPGIILAHPTSADVNCDGDVTLGDVMILVDHLFIGGAPLNCCHSL